MALFLSKFTKLPLKDALKVVDSTFPELSTEAKALASQFQTFSTRLNEPEILEVLNSNLRNKTFVTGNTPAKADLIVFVNILPIATQWKSAEDLAKFRHILRWADLVQNTLIEVPADESLKVNLDAELPREIKEKKKPAASAASAADVKTNETAKASNKEVASEEPKKGSKSENSKVPTDDEKKQIAEAARAKKEAKARARAEQQAMQAPAVPANPGMIDLRVGFIQEAIRHPNADSLYVSTIDMGDEEGPRTVCSGLVNHIPLEDMQERYVICVANLKPVTMRGVKSCAMVLCASNENTVEFVNPPVDSQPGDKIFFEGYNSEPEKQLNPKKKVWETVQPGFSTTENFEVTYSAEGKEPVKLVNAKGKLCKNSTIVKAHVN